MSPNAAIMTLRGSFSRSFGGPWSKWLQWIQWILSPAWWRPSAERQQSEKSEDGRSAKNDFWPCRNYWKVKGWNIYLIQLQQLQGRDDTVSLHHFNLRLVIGFELWLSFLKRFQAQNLWSHRRIYWIHLFLSLAPWKFSVPSWFRHVPEMNGHRPSPHLVVSLHNHSRDKRKRSQDR